MVVRDRKVTGALLAASLVPSSRRDPISSEYSEKANIGYLPSSSEHIHIDTAYTDSIPQKGHLVSLFVCLLFDTAFVSI